ncbi:hypothetical protein Hanom_Chr15g01345041 [Helianthus anomalus]
MGHGGTLDSSELATTTSDPSNLHQKALDSTTSVLFVGGEHASKASCRGLADSRISVSLSYCSTRRVVLFLFLCLCISLLRRAK